MNMIQIKNMSFCYDESQNIPALKNINLEVMKGEVIVLTGKSGCGKTTLIRCLNGMIPETFEGILNGKILLSGENLLEMKQYEISRKIGSVFQDPRSQFFTVNTTDEVAFGCENFGLDTIEINKRVNEAFNKLFINELRDKSIFSLSSGEKQKIAIASVYAMNTDLILMDEPSANLDPGAVSKLRQILCSLKEEGKTIIISEHRLSYLNGIADRFVYMAEGKIKEIWNKEQIQGLSEEQLETYGLRAIKEVVSEQKNISEDTDCFNSIEMNNICASYGSRMIFRDFYMKTRWGEDGKIVGLVGENGAGKTTFAKILCGLIKTRRGSILLDGKKVNQNTLTRKTYFVMQDADYQLFTESVRQELVLAEKKNHVSKDKQMILQQFGLSGLDERHPLSLSGGQKQRLTIAAAIAADSRIVVFDEPTSGLDGYHMRQLKETMMQLKSQGKLILVITHDMEFLNHLCEEIICFERRVYEVKEKRKNPLKGILCFAGDKKKELMKARILSLLSVLAGFIPYLCITILLNSILEKTMEPGRVIALLALAWTGYLIKTLLFSKATMMSHRAAYQIMKNIRMKLMDKLAKMPMGEIQKKSAGEIKHLVIDDVEQLEYPLAHAIPEQMGYTLLPVLVVIFLVTIDFRLALASLASAVLGTLAYSGIMLGHTDMMKRYMEANATMNGTIVEYINGMEVIKAFNQGDSSFKKFQIAVINVKNMTLKWYRRCWPYMSLGQAIMPSCIAFVLPVGILLLGNGSVTQGELITSIVLALGIVGALQKRMEFREHEAVFYELQPKIAMALEEIELETTEDFIKEAVKEYDIEFKKVSFAYDKQEVLHDISLKIPQGTSSALIGPSGSGKSTLAKLLNRFWDVTEGEIHIGGRNLKAFSMKELTDMVSYVSQDTFLFGRSIADNIRIGKPDATDEEVMKAARLAQCEEFIQRFPEGYHTNAADAGKRLSGGERQRIVLARAILKDAPIVLLDEATAFVDPENEDKIQEAITAVTKNKTLIMIAHRLSTVMFLDQLILLEKGKIAAKGTHEELLDTSDTYKRMWKAYLASTVWSMGGGAQND